MSYLPRLTGHAREPCGLRGAALCHSAGGGGDGGGAVLVWGRGGWELCVCSVQFGCGSKTSPESESAEKAKPGVPGCQTGWDHIPTPTPIPALSPPPWASPGQAGLRLQPPAFACLLPDGQGGRGQGRRGTGECPALATPLRGFKAKGHLRALDDRCPWLPGD